MLQSKRTFSLDISHVEALLTRASLTKAVLMRKSSDLTRATTRDGSAEEESDEDDEEERALAVSEEREWLAREWQAAEEAQGALILLLCQVLGAVQQ